MTTPLSDRARPPRATFTASTDAPLGNQGPRVDGAARPRSHAAGRVWGAAGWRVVFGLLVVWVVVLVVDVCPAVAQLNELTTFGSAGSGGGEFVAPQGVGVDETSGDVYVVDAGNFRVEKFDRLGCRSCWRSVRVLMVRLVVMCARRCRGIRAGSV